MPVEQAYPARLQERIEMAGYRARVVNAGVSGETTAGGLRRIGWSLTGDVEILILALGGNDGLRGLPGEQMRDNLAGMIAAALESGARVLLAGMEAPPNFGADYADRFRAAFEQLAAEYDVVFVPFLLDGVAGVAGLNQADGIHPNAAGGAAPAPPATAGGDPPPTHHAAPPPAAGARP
ncbi:MAG: arylesterase, partial [Acidobacteria bacterium]|nr:arylesterase [Acidobacteriota bacterium]